MTAIPTARALTTAQVQHEVEQIGHGFDVGDIVIDDIFGGPPNWVLAQANTVSNCFCSMMVSSIINVDRFVVTQVGFVQNVTSQVYTPGGDYFLSPTIAGDLTAIAPTTGQVYLPCFKAETSDSGYFSGGSGILLSAPSQLATEIVTASTKQMVANTRYIVESVVNCDLNLPATANLGDVVIVTNNNAGGPGFNEALITQFNVSTQQIRFGNGVNTAGNAGGLNSITQGDTVTLVCASTDNTLWIAEANEGSSWDMI